MADEIFMVGGGSSASSPYKSFTQKSYGLTHLSVNAISHTSYNEDLLTAGTNIVNPVD